MAAFLALGGAISDIGAKCIIRIGTASSVKAAYDSQSGAADFDALLVCVPAGLCVVEKIETRMA